MAGERLDGVLRYLRGLASPRPATEDSDENLLARIVHARDEAAFAALMKRHGPLVWGACRRLLRDTHDAEDAFQATFLVLARNAGSITRRSSLPGWLHGVASRVAARLRGKRLHLQTREQALSHEPATAEDVDPLGPLLDEEINRLSEKYRAPIILCYLDGKTNDEAARELGCPRATVATRLARAREQLRGRLARRGVALSAGALGGAVAPAAVPAALTGRTLKAGVVAGASGDGAALISAEVLTLAKEVTQVMLFTRGKGMVAVGALVVLCAGVGLTVSRGPDAAPPPGLAVAAPVLKEEKAPPALALVGLLRRKITVAALGYKAANQEFLAGRGSGEEVYAWSKRWLETERELPMTRARELAAPEEHLKRMVDLEKIQTAGHEAGRIRTRDLSLAQYARLEAEVWLMRAKAKK